MFNITYISIYSYRILLLCHQDNDPLFSQSPWRGKLTGTDGETLGGFPVKFLVQVVRILSAD